MDYNVYTMTIFRYFKIILCFLFISVISASTSGQSVSPSDAARLAKNQLYILAPQTFKSADEIGFDQQYTIHAETDTLFYIFNLENNQGWIIISADKRVFPLLGWSPEGNYNPDDQPPSFRSFLQKRKDFALIQTKELAKASEQTKNAWDIIEKAPYNKLTGDDEVISFEPILNVFWNQGCDYNAWCPVDENGPCGRAYAGCVATAQSQIMKYWNYPPQGRGSHSYTSQYGELTVNFAEQHYNWQAMPTSAPNDEIAKLLYHVGVSVEMNYANDESAAYSYKVRNSLTEFFKYSFRTRYTIVSNFAESKLIELITNDLYQGRVVYYAGCPLQVTAQNPCHAFVIDGFMSYAGYYIFHFNFGWSGNHNGYFYLQDLVGGGMNFSHPTELITGITPSDCPAFNLPYREDFETASTDCWQSINYGSKAFNWEEAINQNRTPGGNRSAKHSFWAMSNQPEDSYLISPAINLPTNNEFPIELSFWSKNNCPELYSNGKNSVMISVDGGQSFTPIWEASEPEKQWTKTRINLDAFAGQTIQIAFRYEKYDAPDAHTWFIDDIEVKLAQLSPPETATMSVFNISASSATFTGMLVDPGDSPVTDRGIVWSTSTGPTIENHLGIMHAEQGNELFTIQLAGLTEQTTYYARSWATNQQGTGYGNEIVFTAQFTPFVCGESTVSDIEGNEYTTVEIGNQCWLGENLKTTRYRNGLEINNPNCIVNFMNNEWGMDNEGAYLSWNNDDQYRIRYGAIYNLHAIKNKNKLCPAGWHVPHDFEWMLLERNLGMDAYDAGAMGWRGTNEGSKLAGHRELWLFGELRKEPMFAASGFNASPSGWYPFPTFGQGNTDPDNETAWWTSSPFMGGNINRRISYNHAGIERNIGTTNQGHYVRCIRNLPYINTIGVSDVTYTSARTGGWLNIYFDDVESEITRKGLVWSKTANPDLENNQGMIELGSGTDNFYHTLDGLTPRTAYYIKAFAENSLGISYGNEVKFYTLGPAIPCPGEETVTDADGDIYTTIRIGSQCWLAQNLKTTVNNLGEPIERFCHGENDQHCTTYGGFYQWNTLLSGEPGGNLTHEMIQGICPTGWYLPKDRDWDQLYNYLIDHGYNYDHSLQHNLIAKSLASADHWNTFANPPTGSPGHEPAKNNSTGFTAIPAGAYRENQTFIPVGESANFWSLSETIANDHASYYRQLQFREKGLKTDSISKQAALSVRCFKYMDVTPTTEIPKFNSELKIYPNPSTDIFFIESPGINSPAKIEVFDTAGRLILQKKLDRNTQPLHIDLSAYPSGIYHLRVVHTRDNVVLNGRLLKTQ